jgi:hypothetical protein
MSEFSRAGDISGKDASCRPSSSFVSRVRTSSKDASGTRNLPDLSKIIDGTASPGYPDPANSLKLEDGLTAVLVSQEQREWACQDIRSNVEQWVSDAGAMSFDIHEVSDTDLELPQFSSPPPKLKDMNSILRRAELISAFF